MKKMMFWVVFLLGLFFFIGAVITVLTHTAQVSQRITIGAIPYLAVGILLDFITNPAGWLGVLLLVVAWRMKKGVSYARKK